MISKISFCIIGQGSTGGMNRTIASIFRQRLPGREILVWGELPAAQDIKVLRSDGWNETGEINRIRNLLCANATHDFVVLMGAHIELSDGWYEAIKEADYLDIIGSRIVTNDGARAVDWAYEVELGSIKLPYPLAYDEWTTKAYVSGNFMLLRKRAWERIKFDETLVRGDHDDIDFCLRATNAGFRVGVIPQAEAKYDAGNSEATTDVTFDKSQSTIFAFKKAFTSGKETFQSRDYANALAHLAKAAEVVPDDAQTLSLMGWAYYFSGQYEQALEILTQVLTLDPASHDAFRGRGWAFLQSGMYDRAVNDLGKALELVNPNHRNQWVETVRGLSWSNYHIGEFDKAVESFTLLMESSHEHEAALLQDAERGLGWCYYRKGMFAESGAHFAKALLNIDPVDKEMVQDAKRGLELVAMSARRPVPIEEHTVSVMADLTFRPQRGNIFSWGFMRARRLASVLKRSFRKIVSFVSWSPQ